jgi:lactoylglutathione lyase
MTTRVRDPFPILQVSDLERSLQFYVGLLGFELTYAYPSREAPQFVELSVEGGRLGLGATDRPVESATASLWVYADDVDRAVEDLRAAATQIVAEPADQPWGERVASVADPDGYTVHLGMPSA